MAVNDNWTNKATIVTAVVVALAASAYWWLPAPGDISDQVDSTPLTTYIAVAGMVQQLGIT